MKWIKVGSGTRGDMPKPGEVVNLALSAFDRGGNVDRHGFVCSSAGVCVDSSIHGQYDFKILHEPSMKNCKVWDRDGYFKVTHWSKMPNPPGEYDD